MRTIHVTAELDLSIPSEYGQVSDSEIQEWLEFNLGIRGGISLDNLLNDMSMDNIGANLVKFE